MSKTLRKIIHDMLMFIIPKRLKKHLMTCAEASQILAESGDQMGLILKLKFKMHVAICQSCTNYNSQISIIQNAAKNIPVIKLANSQVNQISDSKEKIIRQLNSKK